MIRTRTRAAVACTGIALMVAVGAAACGGSGSSGAIDRPALTKKLHDEAALKGQSDKYINCVGAMVVRYGDAGRTNDYIDGTTTFARADVVESVQGKRDAAKTFTSCLKGN